MSYFTNRNIPGMRMRTGPQSNSKKRGGKRRAGNHSIDLEDFDLSTCFIGVVKNVFDGKNVNVTNMHNDMIIKCHCRGKMNSRNTGPGSIVIFSYHGNIGSIKNGEIIANIRPDKIQELSNIFGIDSKKICNACGLSHNSTSHIVDVLGTYDQMTYNYEQEQYKSDDSDEFELFKVCNQNHKMQFNNKKCDESDECDVSDEHIASKTQSNDTSAFNINDI